MDGIAMVYGTIQYLHTFIILGTTLIMVMALTIVMDTVIHMTIGDTDITETTVIIMDMGIIHTIMALHTTQIEIELLEQLLL